jgi:hypothetical protein
MSSGVSYTAPTIGPKVYVTRGPSGWPETFQRKEADAKLLDFVGPVPLEDLILTFIRQRTLADEPEPTTWAHITHYLARNLSVPVTTIPDAVGVAFWAHVVTAMAAHGQALN